MMSQKATISVPSNIEDSSVVQAHESNSNPNLSNPNSVIKRKRSLPGTPDPNAEVIALSPKSLMATNRFICEVCNKGFQRDQNLQLHRRGHNLPWKLRQRTKDEVVKKKVYVCPEKSCVHNDPCRALGDLTGIKKHFSRKHGEKKWKCDKCSKKYAVQSDWKAHSKICGTRQYKCDCGTIFSRKDSFVTHRAFCDAMAEQNARLPAVLSNLGNEILMNGQAPRVMPQGLQLHGFHSEFGAEPYMANFADVNHDQHKLRMPLWLDHQTSNNSLPLNHPLNLSSNSSSSLFSPGTGTTTTLPEANNMFGTSSSWLNYRYPEAMSFTHANLSMPHGLKLEQEENKVDLSHSVSSLYQSHMEESTRMSGNISAFDNSSNFGLLDPNNMSTTSGNNRSNNNVVEIQNFNNMVNSQQAPGTNNIGGGFSLSSSKSLEHNMVMPRIQEWESGESEIMEKQQLRSSNSNTEDHLTKDFMGVGDGSLSRQMGPVMNLQSQFRGHY